MRWLREAGWVVAVGALIVFVVMRPDRKPLPDPNESRAAFEKLRAEFEEKRARREAALELEIEQIRTDADARVASKHRA